MSAFQSANPSRNRLPRARSSYAVRAQNVSKSYTIVHNVVQHSTIVESAMHKIRSPLQRPEKEIFQALNDISFDVKRGEVLGLIGRNGAGKSTLLKILSRITAPTTGQIEIYGRVGSLLEVGTGFHPELTGRENIFLNGAILGMRKREIEKQFDAIVDFAGTEQFLETPVKRYSSGMYVRLAFAVAAHLNPEILIVDEVLSVGDADFQRKCLGKMNEVAHQQGRTVLFVSHNMAAVRSLCSRCLFLQSGSIIFDGGCSEATERYLSMARAPSDSQVPGRYDLTQRKNTYDAPKVMRQVEIRKASGEVTDEVKMGDSFVIAIEVEGLVKYPNALIGIKFKSDTDLTLANISTRMKPARVGEKREQREWIILQIPNLQFLPGQYWIDVAIKQHLGNENVDRVESAASFHVLDADVLGNGYHFRRGDGIVQIDGDFSIQPADLSSTSSSPEATSASASSG